MKSNWMRLQLRCSGPLMFESLKSRAPPPDRVPDPTWMLNSQSRSAA